MTPAIQSTQRTQLQEHAPGSMTPAFLLRGILLPFLYTRILLLGAGCFAVYCIPSARAVGWDLPTSSTGLNMASHFDGRWYLSIARDGYSWNPHEMSSVAFAPLYPMLMRYAALPFHPGDETFLIAGIAISNLALLIALAYISALLFLDGHDQVTAARTAWAILIFPTSFFLSAVYPMSLFMALAAAGFYHARKQQWTVAGIIAGWAALSRPDGVVLSAGLAIEYLLQFGPRFRRELLPLALGPLGIFAWMFYQWRRFGSPLTFVTAQKAWNSCPLTTVLHSSHAGLQLGAPALFILLAAIALFKLRPSFTAFFVMMFAVMLSADRYWSITRFILVLFPAFMMLGILARRARWLQLAYTLISAPLSVLLMMRFALNLWVA